MGNSASQYEQYRRGTGGQGCIIFILAQVTYSSDHCYRIMSETNIFKNPAWAWDVDCWYRSVMTEMGLNMDDANQAFIVATGWRKQVTENMAEAVEANDPRVHGFLAFQEDPWYRTDAQGVYDPKK